MTSQPSQILFLHWGPGSNASVERAWFQDQLPVHWWDQPQQFRNPALAVEEITQAAEQELLRLAHACGGAVDLLAHSFGGQIAYQLSKRQPQSIRSITMLNCGFSPLRSFVQLGKKLGLTEKAQAAETRLVPETFFPLLDAIVQVPDFFARYWQNTEAMQRYFELAPGGPPLNMDAFGVILNSYLGSQEALKPTRIDAPIPVSYIQGIADPLQDLEEEARLWKEVYPALTVRREEAGHFAHFETPSGAWLPGLSS